MPFSQCPKSVMVEWGTGDRDSHKDAGVKWVHFFCGLYRARLIWSRIRIRPWPERSGSDRGGVERGAAPA